jgi:diguanylate cyclase (GGDEF)-like protein
MSVWLLCSFYGCVWLVAARAVWKGVAKPKWIPTARLLIAISVMLVLFEHLFAVGAAGSPEVLRSLGIDQGIVQSVGLFVPVLAVLLLIPSAAILGAAADRSVGVDQTAAVASCLHKLSQAENMYKLVLESSIGASFVLMLRPDGERGASPFLLVGSNRSLAQMLQIKGGNGPANDDWLQAGDISRWINESAMAALNSKVVVRSERAFTQHNQNRWYWMSVVAEGPMIAGTIVETTSQRHSHAEQAQSANTDPLTKLANRRRLNDIVDIETHRARHGVSAGFTAYFLDFDRFKHINDTMGHDVGDELLRQIAARLREAVTSVKLRRGVPAVTLARYGGDEFIAIVPGLTQEPEVLELAEHLLKAFRTPYTMYGKSVQSTASIGAAVCTGQFESGAAVIKAADEAMYRAKQAGKDRCVLHGRPDAADAPHAPGKGAA